MADLSVPKGKLRIYACGGAGTNLGSRFLDQDSVEGVADIEPVFIDTSLSNIPDNVSEERCYILKDKDGSGGVRKENYEDMLPSIKPILNRFAPMDCNLVIFSGGGGSGSVMGSLIMYELLSRGELAIAIVVGSTNESFHIAKNTLETLRGLAGVSKKTDKMVGMFYCQNSPDVTQSYIDDKVATVVGLLAILMSRQNRRLDSRDLIHWVNFDKTTSSTPCLANLEVFVDETQVEDPDSILSLASLYTSPDDTHIDLMPEYVTNGYLRDENAKVKRAHFAFDTDRPVRLIKDLEKVVAHHESLRTNRTKQPELVKDDQINDFGLDMG